MTPRPFPKGDSTSPLRVGTTMSPFLAVPTGASGSFQDGHGGPGTLVEEGVELQQVLWEAEGRLAWVQGGGWLC